MGEKVLGVVSVAPRVTGVPEPTCARLAVRIASLGIARGAGHVGGIMVGGWPSGAQKDPTGWRSIPREGNGHGANVAHGAFPVPRWSPPVQPGQMRKRGSREDPSPQKLRSNSGPDRVPAMLLRSARLSKKVRPRVR